jgi:hypothetical protein
MLIALTEWQTTFCFGGEHSLKFQFKFLSFSHVTFLRRVFLINYLPLRVNECAYHEIAMPFLTGKKRDSQCAIKNESNM